MTMDQDEKLEARTISTYLEAIASDAPAPGCGSVAGVIGAFAAALGEMVANLTSEPSQDLVAARDKLTALRASAIAFGGADELAYPGYLTASRLPKTTDEEKALRKSTMQEAIREAAAIPMQLADAAVEILEALKPVIAEGNKNVVSDAEAAIIMAQACIDTCMINVRVNTRMIRDPETSGSIAGRAQKLQHRSLQLVEDLRKSLAAR
jgi:formiminotetrahydrofolate cyclodeaminase